MLKSRTIKHFSSRATHADICVVGGGIVGAAFACGLGISSFAKSKKIIVIESGNLTSNISILPNEYSNRVSSITNRSFSFLNEISRLNKFTRMSVWDAHGNIEFGDGEDSVARIIENRIIHAGLVKKLEDFSNVTLLKQTTVTDIGSEDERPVLTLNDGMKIRCDLLVGADGPNSKVKSFAGIETSGFDYNQSGLVGTVTIEETDNKTAYQRFLQSGPIALLPLSCTKSSIVWSLSPKDAKKVAKLDPKRFTELLNAAFCNPNEDIQYLISQIDENGDSQVDFQDEVEWGQSRIPQPAIETCPPRVLDVDKGSRACFPLKIRHVERYFGDRVVLIGDAAHTIHPLAGQGLNLGLADAKSLSFCLSKAIRDGQDVGHQHILEEYNSERYLANAAMLASCDMINRLFSNDNEILRAIRSVGMKTFNSIDPLKKLAMRFAN